MPLLKNNVLVPDTWINADVEDELPAAGDVIVPFARLLKDFGALSERDGKLGVQFGNTDRPEALARSSGVAPRSVESAGVRTARKAL